MNFSGKALLALALLFAMPAMANPALESESEITQREISPYVEVGTDFEITAEEYSDLVAYMQRAKEFLENGLFDAKALTGERLHRRLRRAIKDALADSVQKQELVLFRYILSRALEIDQVYQDSGTDEAYASTWILLRSIQLSLKYFQDQDLPRVTNKLIHAPEWTGFATDQIGLLLAVTSLAPSKDAKLEVMRRAVGWTARSLNSSPDRRQHAKRIVKLGQMLDSLRSDPGLVPEAQHLLLAVQNELVVAEKKKTKSEFPRESYPATFEELKKDSTIKGGEKKASFLPLIKTSWDKPLVYRQLNEEERVEEAKRNGKDPLASWEPRDNDNEAIFGRVSVDFGAGISTSEGTGEVTSITTNASAVVVAGDKMIADAHADLKTNVGVDRKGLRTYDVKLQGWAAPWLPLPFGLWAAIEAQDFEKYSSRLQTAGLGLSYPIQIGKKNYILIKIGYGWTEENFKQAANVDGDVAKLGERFKSYGSDNDAHTALLGTVLQLARFALNIEVAATAWNFGSPNELRRTDVTAALSIPLGLIFPNDVLKVDFRHIEYDVFTDGVNDATVKTQRAGAFYELQW